MELLKCQRNGCKKQYTLNENTEQSCNFHPGKPLFHDLKKGWTCCNKIVYDWDEFQLIPTCDVGQHSQETDGSKNQDQFFRNDRSGQTQMTEQKSEQPVVLSIDDFNKKVEEEKKKAEQKPQTIFLTKSGKYKCINKGCNKEYEPDQPEGCNYHVGQPIFHDCVKYWSCCKKETWDWDDFMKLPTCTQGQHQPKMK